MWMTANLLTLKSGCWTLQVLKLQSCYEDSGNNFGLNFMDNLALPCHWKWEDKSLNAQTEAWEHTPTHNKHIWDAKRPWVLGTTTTTTNSIHTHIFLLSEINTKWNSSDPYWTMTTTFSRPICRHSWSRTKNLYHIQIQPNWYHSGIHYPHNSVPPINKTSKHSNQAPTTHEWNSIWKIAAALWKRFPILGLSELFFPDIRRSADWFQEPGILLDYFCTILILHPPPSSKHRDFPYHRGNSCRQEIGCSSKTDKSNFKSSPTHQNTNKTSKKYMDHHPSDTKREITPQFWNSGSRKRSATHWSTWNYMEQNHIKNNTQLLNPEREEYTSHPSS